MGRQGRKKVISSIIPPMHPSPTPPPTQACSFSFPEFGWETKPNAGGFFSAFARMHPPAHTARRGTIRRDATQRDTHARPRDARTLAFVCVFPRLVHRLYTPSIVPPFQPQQHKTKTHPPPLPPRTSRLSRLSRVSPLTIVVVIVIIIIVINQSNQIKSMLDGTCCARADRHRARHRPVARFRLRYLFRTFGGADGHRAGQRDGHRRSPVPHRDVAGQARGGRSRCGSGCGRLRCAAATRGVCAGARRLRASAWWVRPRSFRSRRVWRAPRCSTLLGILGLARRRRRRRRRIRRRRRRRKTRRGLL